MLVSLAGQLNIFRQRPARADRRQSDDAEFELRGEDLKEKKLASRGLSEPRGPS